MKKSCTSILFLFLVLFPVFSFSQVVVSEEGNSSTQFSLSDNPASTAVFYDSSENILIEKAANFFADDIDKVLGRRPKVVSSGSPLSPTMIIIGTVGNNPLINQLVGNKKLDVNAIKGQWEQFIIQTIDKPFPGVKQALVIVGSDRRGAAYGVFTLSEKIGVSPWY